VKPAASKGSLIAAAVAGVLAAGAAGAADWEFNPSIEAGYLYDNNYRLTAPGTEISVQGPMADAQLEMRARNPQGEFSFTPRIRATYFPSEQDLDTTDYFGTLYWLRRGPKLQTEITGDFAQQDVVNSEQPDAEVPGNANLGDTNFGDAGRVLVKNRRTRASVLPSMSYEISPRHALELAANLADVSFDNQIPGAQVDYRSADLLAGLKTRISETSSITTRVRGARFDIETEGDSKSYGLELEWDTQSVTGTETFLRGGAQKVDLANGESENTWLAGGGMSRAIGRNQLFFDLSRSVGPSSAGVVITRDQLRLRWTRDLTPRLQFQTGLRGTHDEGISPDSPFTTRSYATGDVGLQWHWQEEFALRVAYDYTWQKYDNGLSDPAKSSGAIATILYQPLQRRR